MHDNDAIAITERFNSDAYFLLEKIGEGGFGQVYKACQRNTGQLVAIKFLTLDPGFSDDKKERYIDRFERETLLGSRLQHPHIVRLLDKGVCDDELLYAVFEYVDGLSLKQVLEKSGPLSPVTTAQLMGQILDALAHAHEQGVIHRDIKPANIMLSQVGAKTHGKVLDFGIGTLVNEARQLDYKSITLTQETLGTPSYSAPEQLRGEPPTPKTDLYVWGLVFIECLTGKPAVSGASLASIFHQQLSQSNVPLPAAVVGHPVGALLRRVLNKKVDERIDKASDLYHQLQQLNLSTLVGELAEQSSHQAGPDDSTQLPNTAIQTRVQTHAMSFTRLIERKQITVLCVSLDIKAVDGADVDDEVIDTLLWDQLSQCQDIAIRYGAFHVGTLGDTLLFYFGYPVASDNDSRLAARTALEITSELNKRNLLLRQTQGVETQVRMGLNTGMVTAFADAVPQGKTPNMAMKLACRASENQALCTSPTRLQLDTHIEFKPVRSTVIGVNGQVQSLYTLSCERQSEAFGFLRGNRRKNSFVGRQAQLSSLLARVNPPGAKAARKTVHLYGEAGIGKSRLVFEFRDLVRGFTRLVAQCLPEYKNSALYPVLNVIKYQYALDTLSAEDTVSRLREIISGFNRPELIEALPVLFAWLGLALPEDIAPSSLTPDKQKQRLFDILTMLLFKVLPGGDNRPNLLIFEDMHWADPTSIEFIGQLLNSEPFLQGQHALVSTSRQALPDVFNDPDYLSLELLKLGKAETTQFIIELFDNQTLSDNLLNTVVERTDGIPLFIEELVNMLKQQQLVHQINGRFDFISAEKQAQLPNNLRDSLQQKLDLLLYAKETVQLAATIGREFDYDLLVKASSHDESQVQSDLDELVAAELVYKQRKVSGDGYIFKHALVKDTAYESMLEKHKQNNHNKIGTTLVNDFASLTTENPGLLAWHFSSAKNYQSATEFGIAHSKQQVGRSQNLEALSTAYANLQWSEKVAAEAVRVELLLLSYEVLLSALTTTKGFGAEELIEVIDNIQGLIARWASCSAPGSGSRWDELVDKTEWVQFSYYHYRSEMEKARDLGNALAAKARAKDDKKKLTIILIHLAQANEFNADLKTAIAQFNESISLYDQLGDPNLGFEYGFHAKALPMVMRSICHYYLGDVDKTLALVLEGIEYAESIKNDASITFAYLYIGFYYSSMGINEKVIEYLDIYYQKHHKTREEVWLTLFIDLLYACAKRDLKAAEQYFSEMTTSGQSFVAPLYTPFISRAYIAMGDYDKAVNLLQPQLDNALKIGMRLSYGSLKSLLAKALYLQTGEYAGQVAHYYQSAITDAQGQGAAYLELQILADNDDIAGASGRIDRSKRIQEILDENRVSVGSPAYLQALDIVNAQT